MSVFKRGLRGALTILIAALVVPSTFADDLSKKVELQFYMLGNAPKDLEITQAEINKMAEKELNATVKFNFTTWTGWDQKYSLLLTSGQPIDLIFTAEWTGYNDYAKRGAFLDIGPLLPKAAPDLYKFVPQDMWNAVKVGGKIYTVPATWKEYVNNGILYREDLRKKYNLPKPDSLANLERYLEGIKKNVPDMQPTFQSKANPYMESLMEIKYPWIESPIGTFPSYGLRYHYKKPGEIFNYWTSKDFIEDAKLFKRFADKGFWSKSALSVDSPNDALETGAIALRLDGQNAVKYATLVGRTAQTHPDWEWGYYPYVNSNFLVHPVHPIHNGFAVPRSSKNPERALAFYAKLVLDKRYNWLTEYGIQGKNFNVSEDGHYVAIGDSTTNGFPREAMQGWAWRNPEFQIFDASFDIPFALFKEWDKIATPNIRDGFAEDKKAYQAELASFNQVWVQYGLPIYWGLAGDPEAAVKKFLEKAKAAGYDKIVTEVSKQWKAYIQEIQTN